MLELFVTIVLAVIFVFIVLPWTLVGLIYAVTHVPAAISEWWARYIKYPN